MKKIIPFIVTLILFSFTSHAGTTTHRFFLEGDGQIAFKNINSGRKVVGSYRNANGEYDPEILKQIDRLFNMPSQSLGEDIDLRLIAMLDYFQDKYAPHQTLKLRSVYRSPQYNAVLRQKGRKAGLTSYHMEGMAVDLVFPGADHKKMWKEIYEMKCCGVGYYGGGFLHIDSGKPRFWDQTTAIPAKPEPQLNSHIYLSVDKDIYLKGETIRLYLSGISDYPFGVKTKMTLISGDKSIEVFTPKFTPSTKIEKECALMDERQKVRFMQWSIPKKLKAGANKLLQIKMEFCPPVYEKMPQEILSRNFQIR